MAEICRRAEGMPLIELFAARMDVFEAEEVAELDRFWAPFKRQQGGQPTPPDPQGNASWSYEFLGEPERRLFGRLSAFACGLLARSGGGGGEGFGIQRSDVFEAPLILMDKSLVVARPTGDPGAPLQYSPVRQYAGSAGGERGG